MKKTIFAVLMGTALAAPFSAQAEGGYIGLNIGQVDHRVDDGFVREALPGIATVSRDEKKTGFKLYGGYGFTRNWGVEIGYANLGKINTLYNFAGAAIDFNYKARALYVAGTGTLPVNDRFSLFGKLGVTRNHASANLSVAGISLGDSGNRTSGLAGVGAAYDVTQNIAVTLEYEDFGKLDDDFAKASLFSLGLRYKF